MTFVKLATRNRVKIRTWWTLFYKQRFYKQTRLKLAKNQTKAKQHPGAALFAGR